VRLVGVKFFERGINAPPLNQVEIDLREFDYVYAELQVHNNLSGIRDNTVHIQYRYYSPDGSLFGEPAFSHAFPSSWEHGEFWAGWGAAEPGVWKAGQYRVEVVQEGSVVAEGSFTVTQ
jgi:hypothetical protein